MAGLPHGPCRSCHPILLPPSPKSTLELLALVVGASSLAASGNPHQYIQYFSRRPQFSHSLGQPGSVTNHLRTPAQSGSIPSPFPTTRDQRRSCTTLAHWCSNWFRLHLGSQPQLSSTSPPSASTPEPTFAKTSRPGGTASRTQAQPPALRTPPDRQPRHHGFVSPCPTTPSGIVRPL